MFPVAVTILELQPSEFWQMTPEEFRWIWDFKFKGDKEQVEERIERNKKILELPEARPSKSIKRKQWQ